MDLLLAFIIAVAVTMSLIPPLMRAAGSLHVLDQPGERKQHVGAIPCVGGVAMAAGADLGTFKRSMDLFGGQAAIEMSEKGFDDKTVRQFAPVIGAVNAALTVAQFDLMLPSAKAPFLKKALGSAAVRKVQ